MKRRQSFGSNRALGKEAPDKKVVEPARRPPSRSNIEAQCWCGWKGPVEKFGAHEHKKRTR